MKSKRYSRKASQVGSGKTRERDRETEREREIQDDEGDSYHDFRVWTASICHYSAPCWFQRISLKIKKKIEERSKFFFWALNNFRDFHILVKLEKETKKEANTFRAFMLSIKVPWLS